MVLDWIVSAIITTKIIGFLVPIDEIPKVDLPIDQNPKDGKPEVQTAIKKRDDTKVNTIISNTALFVKSFGPRIIFKLLYGLLTGDIFSGGLSDFSHSAVDSVADVFLPEE
ncbi:hypothetical protein HDU76_008872 [Blyttiomyces sp. JEL0837]|nr:hypothetical protein HDU76_008872 [Blyttiomyces sp. JEL0837]